MQSAFDPVVKTKTLFGRLDTGEDVHALSLQRGTTQLVLLTYGAALLALRVPDKHGRPVDVIDGPGAWNEVLTAAGCMGKTVGRVCNRTEDARFWLNGKTYELPANEGRNHLHGTYRDRVFGVRDVENGWALTLHSPDGEEGYPGSLCLEVRVTLPAEGRVEMEYLAVADGDTPINITNHTYWNLAGEGDCLDHELWLGASRVLEVRPDSCPTGRLLPVAGTPFDFTAPRPLGEGLANPTEQMELVHGYDHNFVLDQKGEEGLAASLFCPRSGIRLRLYTSQPGLQVYTANWLGASKALSKRGAPFADRQSVALEAQRWPCALSHPDFPSIIVRAGEFYRESQTLVFDTL